MIVTKKNLLIIIILLLCINVNATTYYVAKDGNDSNNGSEASPWSTISHGVEQLSEGDILYVKQGIYYEEIRNFNRSGTAEDPIIISAYSGDEVIVDAENSRDYGFYIYGVQYISITGFILRNTIENGIKANQSQHIHVKNNTVYDTQETGIEIGWNCSGALVEDNYVYNTGSHSIYVSNNNGYSTDNCIVRNNVCDNSSGNNIQFNGYSFNQVIENNIVSNSGGLGIMALGISNSIIRFNVIYESTYEPLGFGLASVTWPADHAPAENKVYHNTLVGNTKAASFKKESHDNRVVNNILKVESGNVVWAQDDNEYTADNNHSCYNYLYRAGASDYYSSLITGKLDFYNDSDSIGFYIADPQFVDENNREYQLKSSSELIDTGTFLTVTNSSGTGTQISVDDASYFFDGYGKVEGDWVQLDGQTERAKIINVDKSNDLITVDRTITWEAGQGVSLAYNGSAPDIGAHEYEAAFVGPDRKYLVHHTFERSDESWGGALDHTSYKRDQSFFYAGDRSMHVYANGEESKLSVGVNLAGWNIDQFPFLSFSYKIPEGVPVGIFFKTESGWVCLGGSENLDAGSYPLNDAYRLTDDNNWHRLTLNVRDEIRELYPTVNTISEFEWYTQENGQPGDEFWYDELMIFVENEGPLAWISTKTPNYLKEGENEISLITSKDVINSPISLTYTATDNSEKTILLDGSTPGSLFKGIFSVDNDIVEGPGYFSLPVGILEDQEGNTGDEIINGAKVIIDKISPLKPQGFKKSD